MVVPIHIAAIFLATTWSMIGGYKHFKGTYYLRFRRLSHVDTSVPCRTVSTKTDYVSLSTTLSILIIILQLIVWLFDPQRW